MIFSDLKILASNWLKKYTKDYELLPTHFKEKTAEWAENISGVPDKIIKKFANILCKKTPSYFRLGYGFSRQRNGSFNMHAVSCIPTILGSWKHRGGGAFYNNADIYNINKDTIIPVLKKMSITYQEYSGKNKRRSNLNEKLS